MSTIVATIQQRRDTEANWASNNPILLNGEQAFSSDAFYSGTNFQKMKVGNGVNHWSDLNYLPAGGSGISGLTTGKYTKAASATTIADAVLSDDGTNVILPTGKYFTGSNISKARIDFAKGGVDGDVEITSDGGTGANGVLFAGVNTTKVAFGSLDYIQFGLNSCTIASGGTITLSAGVSGKTVINTAVQLAISGAAAGRVLRCDNLGNALWSTINSTDVGLGNVENTALSTWAGSSNITTVGTLSTLNVTTSITSPLLIGGTGVADFAEIRATSANGSGESIRFTGGNNGSNEFGRFIVSSSIGRLIVGATSLTFAGSLIEASRSQNTGTNISIVNTSTGSAAYAAFVASNGTINSGFGTLGSNYTTSGAFFQNGTYITASGTGGLSITAINASGSTRFYTGGSASGNLRMTLRSDGGIVLGNGALATSATAGHLYIQSCAGVATGVPQSVTGMFAMIYDNINKKIGIYDGGWIWTAALS